MNEKIRKCIEGIQSVLREHGCVIRADQHYSEDCWIEVTCKEDHESCDFDLITGETFEEKTY